MTKTSKLLSTLALFVSCISASANLHSAAAQTSATLPDSAPRMIAASVKAAPDLRCTLQLKGEPTEAGIPVFTDGDGYARFHAVKLSTDSPHRLHTLSCTDERGRASAYDVDLASEETFVRRFNPKPPPPDPSGHHQKSAIAPPGTMTNGLPITLDQATHPGAFAHLFAPTR